MSGRFRRSSPTVSACRRAAITGQSGHQTHPVRVTCASPGPAPLPLPPLIRPARAGALLFPRRARRARPVRAGLHRIRAPTSSTRAYRRRDASAGHGPSVTSTVARSRARAVSRRASPGRSPGGTEAATSETPSSRAPTTVDHRSGGTRRTIAHRSRATPTSAAARAPNVPSGSTTAAHSPTEVVAAASRSATVVDPAPGGPSSVTVLPRRIPPAGRSCPIGPATARSRSPASTAGAVREAVARNCARACSSRRGRPGTRLGEIGAATTTRR